MVECSLAIDKSGQIGESLVIVKEVHSSIKILGLMGFNVILNEMGI